MLKSLTSKAEGIINLKAATEIFSKMFTSTAKHFLSNHRIKCRFVKTMCVGFNGTRPLEKCNHLTLLKRSINRQYCAPAWHMPLGNVPMPRKTVEQPRSTEITPLEDLVDKKSLLCLEDIHNAFSTSEVYQALGRLGIDDLNEVHIARAITKLAEIHIQDLASPPSSPPPQEGNEAQLATATNIASLNNHKEAEFVRLCHLTLRSLKAMDSESLLRVLKAVIDLGVPQSSAMIQTLLVSTENRLNQLNCSELALLANILSCLNQMDQGVHAMLQAVVLLVPGQLSTCMHTGPLSTLLHTIGKHLSRRTHGEIAMRIAAILNVQLFDTHMPTNELVLEAATAVKSFSSIRYHNVQFLKEACEILLNGIELLSLDELTETLCSLTDLEYYSPMLLERLGSLIADRINECSPRLISMVLDSYSSQQYLHEKLFNSVEVFLIGKPLDQESTKILTGILSPFAKLLHTLPPSSCRVSELIRNAAETSHKSYQGNLGEDYKRYLYLTALLAMCGSFSLTLIEIALSKKYWQSVVKEKDPKALFHLHILHAIVTIDKPPPLKDYLSTTDTAELSQTLDWVTRERIDDARNKTDKKDEIRMSVGEVIQKEVLRHPEFSLETDVIISHGYSVDFLVDKTGDNIPIAIDLITGSSQYVANYPDILLNKEAIKVRHLANLGCQLHMVRELDWLSLHSDEGRAAYIGRIVNLLRATS